MEGKNVNCRIGSLENTEPADSIIAVVNCRIGSLEMDSLEFFNVTKVNCRIGSLEKKPHFNT